MKVLTQNEKCISNKVNLKNWIEDTEIKINKRMNTLNKIYLKKKKLNAILESEQRKIELLFNNPNNLILL